MPFSTERQGALRTSPSASRIAALALIVLAPLALGGCSWLGMGSDEDDVMAEIAAVAPKPCPTVGVLDGADRITVFNGQGQDLTDVVVRAEISKAAIQCKYDIEDKTISVDLAFNGLAVMGPAATNSEMSLKGFLAVTRIDGAKVSKQIYDIPIDFDKERQVRFLKSVEGTVVPYRDDQNGSSYVFLVGFQVSQSQLDYNRKATVGPLQ
ncbi:MAG: hypothetical protein Q7S99_06810 [Parvibaculum sp.]|nr:hypothetical protein [Parvibaculum sp.]